MAGRGATTLDNIGKISASHVPTQTGGVARPVSISAFGISASGRAIVAGFGKSAICAPSVVSSYPVAMGPTVGPVVVGFRGR